MALFSLFVLALVQALSEFLPVSSTGHLIIASDVFGLNSTFAIDVMLHMGTLIALVIYYRKKIQKIIAGFMSGGDNKLLINIIISTIPAVIAGFAFADFFAGDARDTKLVSIMLLTVGLLMFLERQIMSKRKSQTIDDLTKTEALAIGVAQSVALVPGTSRSGISMLAGRWFGLNSTESADYAFLIGIPAIFGAGIKVFLTTEAGFWMVNYPFDAFFGIAITAMVGYLAIDLVLRVVKKAGLKWFGAYRIALALILFMVI